ncbi:MerR family transcriptional regulator [Demequina sp. TTPB684]|uniref:MerR family transcriptional regulator n=1 Tax=unclassified Demequina TaxID=2620311 RepID=UPI001CF2E58B|nr:MULTISPECIES: MerR family transcriptional regulator [unclassified Demequina]MCB2413448.1 MerR family transcriptional regulator [Demequina sp. TTPB684]UPU88753.1 MerR family transcriptional regulator [Demequina sp. TMPB413]
MESDYDIGRVAKMSGVTSRTLRHYDDIGLLTPAWTGSDGRRRYGQAELLRLQHILVLRELGTSLDRIARIVDSDDPSTTIALLRDHLAGLTAERERYARLAATVARTIDSLEKGKTMTTEHIFDGFDHEQYEPEARERWGDDAVDRSNAMWQRLGDAGKKEHMRIDREIVEALGAAVRVGFAADSAEVQEIAAKHHAWVSQIWTPDAEAYRSLTQMYVDDERFKAHYDEVAPGAAELLRDAADQYARAQL